MHNIICLNVVEGARGHQIGRLISSCENVQWYNWTENGSTPWTPNKNPSTSNLSIYHFDRRFDGAVGVGVCDKTVPPVLDFAKRNKYVEISFDKILDWGATVYPNNLLYVSHSDLDQSKDFFQHCKHIVVINENIDEIVERYLKTTANFIYSWTPTNSDDWTIECQRLTFKEAVMKEHPNVDYTEWVENYITKKLKNFKENIGPNDFVISRIEDLFDQSMFKSLCKKFNLTCNSDNYNKVYNFVKDDNYANN